MFTAGRRPRTRILALAAVVLALGWVGAPDAARASGAAAATGTTAVWPAPSRSPLDAATRERLRAQLDDYVEQRGLVGATAAVVTPSGSWTGAAGADGRGVRLRTTSALAVASTTKTFVAAEILLLAQRGRISLDAPVTRYVKVPFDTHGATVRQLATMTSGFPTVPNAVALAAAAADTTRRWTCADTLALLEPDAERVGVQGGPAAYNGLNYVVLAMVVEKVTRTPLSVALRRDLLGPARLDRVWMQAGAVPERPAPPRAWPVDDPASPVVDVSTGFLPSTAAATSYCGGTGIAADAVDLARWGYLLYGGRVLAPRLVSVMTTPNPQGGDFGYGFGTMVADWDGTPFWGHAGDYAGYTSILFAWPQTRTTVAVLVPAGGGPDGDVRADLAIMLYLALQP